MARDSTLKFTHVSVAGTDAILRSTHLVQKTNSISVLSVWERGWIPRLGCLHLRLVFRDSKKQHRPHFNPMEVTTHHPTRNTRLDASTDSLQHQNKISTCPGSEYLN